MKQVWLETGGKSPNLIFPDADLDAAADKAAFGIFFNQGEVCSANSRMLVHESIADEMAARMVARAAAYQPGDPLDPASRMGPLVTRGHADTVMGFIDAGRQEAQLLCGGERLTLGGSDAYVQPTVFLGAAPSARIVRKEIFGPVLSIQTFRTEEEAIALANDTPYGLAASLWTRDLNRALRLSDRLVAGTVSVNTVDALSAMTPFGGLKQSGFGRDLSLHSFDKYTALKTVWVKYS